jgi:hypothetical protein
MKIPRLPTTDPKLPSYEHPTLQELRPDLKRALDVYSNLRGVEREYLPPEPAEPPEAYEARLGRAGFASFFRDSLKAFVGLLSKFELSNPPATMEQASENIDFEGSSLTAWWLEADRDLLRDGGTWLQVEMSSVGAANSGEETAMGLRPYLVRRPRSYGVNWRTSVADGVRRLEWVVFLELIEEPDGDFGTKLVPKFRQIGAGWQSVWRMDQDSSGKWHAIPEIEKQPILSHRKTPLSRVPVVWYAADKAGPGEGELPLRQVVAHCIEHFQRRSDVREKDHKLNMPVPWVRGRRLNQTPMTPAAQDAAALGMMQPAPFVIGPNTIVELEENGEFGFAEPSASSMKFSQEQIDAVEKLITRQTLDFLYGDSTGNKTAMQAGLESAQTEATMKDVAERKSSTMQELMAIWVEFTGESLAPDAGLSISSTLFEKPLEAVDIDQIQKLAGGVELMSQRSAVETLQRAGVNRVTTSVDDELQRLADEAPEPAETPGVNDAGML